MSKQIVVLVNKCLPYNVVGKLRGISGVEYGHSIYEDAYAGHVAKMEVDDYREAKDDIAKGMTLRFNQWSVDFEDVVEPEKVVPVEHTSEIIEPAVSPSDETPSPAAEVHTAESLAPLKYFALVKIAKELGIDSDKINGSEPLRKAILEKQGAK